jgi:iron(III) transport system substrate-binding protein
MTLFTCGCSKQETVTVYTSVDRNYSELVFQDFEQKTGVRVLPVYDTEASKTTGLVNRLIVEKDKPIADVFWNGEFSQTILLKEKGVFQPYVSPNSALIPDNYKDKDGYWAAFGGRARCLLVNTDLMDEEDYPSSFNDFLNDKYEATKIGMAYPMFGTTATHASALFSVYGEEDATVLFKAIKNRGVRIVDGNGAVRDLVANGTLLFGITDTDDAIGAIKNNNAVKIIFPDQSDKGIGTLLIPNTAAMIKGAKQEDNAKLFLDYIYSSETEKLLMDIGWTQVSVRSIEVTMPYFEINTIKMMDLSLEEVYQTVEKAKLILKDVYIK